MVKRNEIDNIDLVVSKSKELLDYQLTCYDTYYNKAGIFISISSLFIPVAFSLIQNFTANIWWTIIFFIPIAVNLIGLYFLIQVVKPKKIYFGIGHHKFEELLKKEIREVKLIEIGANRSSYIDNEPIVQKQSMFLRRGLTFIIVSAFLLSLIILIKFLI